MQARVLRGVVRVNNKPVLIGGGGAVTGLRIFDGDEWHTAHLTIQSNVDEIGTDVYEWRGEWQGGNEWVLWLERNESGEFVGDAEYGVRVWTCGRGDGPRCNFQGNSLIGLWIGLGVVGALTAVVMISFLFCRRKRWTEETFEKEDLGGAWEHVGFGFGTGAPVVGSSESTESKGQKVVAEREER